MIQVAEGLEAGREGVAIFPGEGEFLVTGAAHAEWVGADGRRAIAPGIREALGRIAAVRVAAGGFQEGDLFAGTAAAGGIARFVSAGRLGWQLWTSLPGEAGQVRALAFDDARGELIAATSRGGLWAVDAAGSSRRIAPMLHVADLGASEVADDDNAAVEFEALAVAPGDAAKYGPWAGKILATTKQQRSVYAIDPNGSVEAFDLGLSGINNLQLIPASENLFGLALGSDGRSSMYGVPAKEFAGMSGDWLLTQRGDEACGCEPAIWRISWSGTSFEKTLLGELPRTDANTQWGQAVFSPFSARLLAKLQQKGPNPLVGPAGNPAAAGAGDITINEAVVPAANGVTTLPMNGNTLPSLRFINTVFNNGDVPGTFIISAPTIPAGFTLVASGDGGKTFSSLNNGGTVPIAQPIGANNEERNIDIRLSVPAGTPANVEYDVVIQVTSSTNTARFDRTTDRLRIVSAPPPLLLTKKVTDENGGLTLQGDSLRYSLTVKNVSAYAVSQCLLSDAIPAGAVYVPGSAAIVEGANQGAKTDAIDGDQVDVVTSSAGAASSQISIGIGAGAGGHDSRNQLIGGLLQPGESATVTFLVRVALGLPLGTTIKNTASWQGVWNVDGISRSGNSSAVSSVVSAPDPLVGPFGHPDAVGPTNNNDDVTQLRVALPQANGLTTSSGQVQFLNTLRNAGDVAGRFAVSASSIPAGVQVFASADDGNSFVSLDQGQAALTPADVAPFAANPAAGQRNLQIRVVVPAGLTVNKAYPIGLKVCRDDNPAICNQTTDVVLPDPAPPALSLSKAVRDLAGNDLNGKTVIAGQTIEYTMTLVNRANAAVAGAFITDYLPLGAAYAAGSARLAGGAKTDARGDDEVDYYSLAPPNGNGQLTYLVGAGAGGYKGGTLAANESVTVSFRMTIDPNAKVGTVIGNQAFWGATDFGIGGASNSVSVTVVPPCSPFVFSPAAGELPLATASVDYAVTFKQSGGVAPVSFSVTAGSLPAGLTLDPASGLLSGRPIESGNAAFTITAKDVNGCLGSSAYTLKVDPFICIQTICFHSARYYSLNWGTPSIPPGSVLIGGVNFNSPVSTRDQRVKQALDGQYGELNRQYTAAQLSVLFASGLGAANITTALKSQLRCYGLDFDPTTLAGLATFTPNSSMGDFILYVNGAVKPGASGRDVCILVKLLAALNGDDLTNLCHRNVGKVDLSACN